MYVICKCFIIEKSKVIESFSIREAKEILERLKHNK